MPHVEIRYSNSSINYKNHAHDTFSIGALKKGKRLFKYTNKETLIKPNMLAIVNANQVHSCNTIDEDILSEYYVVYLDKTWCLEIQKSLFSNITELHDFPIFLLNDKNLYREFIAVCELFFSDEFYLKKEEILIEFMSRLYAQYFDFNIISIKSNKFDEIIAYMEENIESNITLDELALKFNMNKYHLTRVFKKQQGLNAHAYFLNLKINKAKELLKEGLSIVNTALELGFVDQSHFHRHFLNIVAATPKEYQNSI